METQEPTREVLKRGMGQGRRGGGGEAEVESDDAESETLINDSFRLFSSCENAFQPEGALLSIT